MTDDGIKLYSFCRIYSEISEVCSCVTFGIAYIIQYSTVDDGKAWFRSEHLIDFACKILLTHIVIPIH